MENSIYERCAKMAIEESIEKATETFKEVTGYADVCIKETTATTGEKVIAIYVNNRLHYSMPINNVKVVTYKEFEDARRNARWLLSQMNESMGFDRAVELDIYSKENGKINTTVKIHEIGMDSVKIMKLAIVMAYANELMVTFPYNGYSIKYED